MNYPTHILLPVILALLCTACEINRVSPIPDTPVSLDIEILRDAPELNVIGGFKEFITPKTVYQYLGYGGIVVFRSFEDKFVAFDLACPHEIKRTVRVQVDMSGIATCPVCGSTFDVGYGTGIPSSGSVAYPLKSYTVLSYGDKLRIIN
ncbi:MAG: hypothetical protein EOM76_06500 [Sphingobacteriia bacterium]|jgi:nitrite reductase/ring-hydroxylating ferredoxin subunit|nr:hypothetical protein [Sphingobacteriia bacterium]